MARTCVTMPSALPTTESRASRRPTVRARPIVKSRLGPGTWMNSALATTKASHWLSVGTGPVSSSARRPARLLHAGPLAPYCRGMAEREGLLRLIRESVIGEDHVMETPYGRRRVTYADYTASGRALTFIEDFIRHQVLPSYANTHTESSGTGLQTTRLREEAREIIRSSVGAGDDCVVIFAGSGCTGAIAKLIGVLGLRVPSTPR